MKIDKKKRKKIRNIIIAVVCIIIVLLIIINLLKENVKDKMPTDINTPEQLLKYYNCKNIRIKDSPEEQFEKDIYLSFGEELWRDGKSNEVYYQAIIINLSKLLQYKSYRMIDLDRETLVAVICNGEKVREVYINGEADYFAKEQTKQEISKYEPILETNINIQSKEILTSINKNWKASTINFGTLESRFDDYDIYFDEGIEVKTLGGKIYNIVFTENYKNNIANNLTVSSTKEEIKKALGKPSFEDDNILGYKSEKICLFFAKNQVSVYRKENEYNTEEFLKLWNDFQSSKDVKVFVNGITNIWNDYNKYQYDTDYVFLEYALRGIRIQFNFGAENGIVLFNNYEGNIAENIKLKDITLDNLPKYLYLHTDDDLIYEKEKERVANLEYYYEEENRNMVDDNYFLEEEYEKTYRFSEIKSNEFFLVYQYVPNEGIREVKFISLSKKYPNSELIRHKQIYTYGWINNEQFVYSVKQEGIYYYNAKTRVLKNLISGNDNFEIKKIESDILFYDEKNVKLK